MDSIELLNFSKKIMQLDLLTEVDYRQVVGRSYYCAFHQLKEKAKALEIPVDAYGGGTHSSVIKTITTHKPRNVELVGLAYRVHTFHSIRVVADYKLEQSVTKALANQALETCAEIIKDLNKIVAS